MQTVSPSNPDTRPLPDGWVQHYEPSKRIWYYVQIVVAPPKVSFVHPADLNASPTNQTVRTPQPPANGPPLSTNLPAAHNASRAYPSPLSPNQPPRAMSAAQRLYASSQGASPAPMINSNNISSLSTSVDVSTNRVAQSGGITMPSPPLSGFPGTQFPPHRQGIDEGGPASALYGGSRKHRSPTSFPAVSNTSSHTIHGRQHAFTMPTPKTQINHSGCTGNSVMSAPRQTPNLLTKAKPPSESTKSSDLLVTRYPEPTPSPNPLSPLNLNSTSPPSTSLLFSSSAVQNPTPISPPVTTVSPVSNVSMVAAQPIPNANVYNTMVNPPDTMTLLKVAFSSGMNGVTEFDLQNVADGRPNANYQAVIDALKQKQVWLSGVQPAAPNTLDYNSLITTVENLQLKAQLAAQKESMAAFKQQEAALAAQQAALNQQALVNMQLLQQQQQQQQALAQQQLQAMHHQQAVPQPTAVYGQTMQQPVQPQPIQQQSSTSGFSSLMGSLHSGSQQQQQPQPQQNGTNSTNSNTGALVSKVGQQVMNHFVHSLMNQNGSQHHGGNSGGGASGGGNSFSWDSMLGGNNQDPSQGLFGGMMDNGGNMDFGSSNMDFGSSMDFGGGFSSGFDGGSYDDNY